MFSKCCKYIKIGPYGLGALLLITVAVVLRLILISNGWPLTNSDEATMGLQALHILTRGERPIFFYGQNYLGVIEAYLGACFFFLFGPSIFALRLGLVILYGGFLLALYLLARLLYSKGVALVSVFLLCLGSSNTLPQQLLAEGYLEPLLFATLSLLLANWLVLSFHPNMSLQKRRLRLIVYGCLGLVIGLGIWSHLLILPFVCTSLLLLLLICRYELCTRASLFGVLGFLVGAFPLFLFNIQHFRDNSLITLWQLYRVSGSQLPAGENFGICILGAILITIPTATSADPLCQISEPSPLLHGLSLSCMGFQAYWGWGVIILWLLAMFAVIKKLLKQYQVFSPSGSPVGKEHLIRCTGQLMLLTSVGLTVLCYVTSPNAALYPESTARYLVGLSVATPAIVAFLWPVNSLKRTVLVCWIVWTMASFSAIKGYLIIALVVALITITVWWPKFWLSLSKTAWAILRTAEGFGKITDYMKIGLLCFISTVLIMGMVTTFLQIPNVQKGIQRQEILIKSLLSHHTVHIYSDYWTCNRLIFLSDERIICSVLNPDLSLGQNRYQPYAQIVAQDPHPAYVFDTENGGVGTYQSWLFTQSFRADYHFFYLTGFAIYLPANHSAT